MEFTSRQLELFWGAFTTPTGGMFVAGFLLLFFLALTIKRIRWFVLPLALWTCTFSYSTTVSGVHLNLTLAYPMESLRPYGRPITGGLLLLLLLPAIVAPRGWRTRLLLPATIALVFFELVISGRTILGGFEVRGFASASVLFIVFLILGLGLSSWLQDWNDVIIVIRCMAISLMIFIGGTIYQVIMNPGAIVWQGRCFATTGNPQHAALVLSAGLLPLCYLLVRRDGSIIWRSILGATLAFDILFLVWTGSRTGALVGVVGLALLFRAKLARWMTAAVVAGTFILIVLPFFGQSMEGASHILSGADTRSGVWARQFQTFREHMAIGVLDEPTNSENSYLATAARFGLLGVVPLAIAVALVGSALWALQRTRRYLGEHMLTADLVTGGLCALLLGAWFEGYLMGVLTNIVMLIYIYLAILAYMLDLAVVSRQQPREDFQSPAFHDLESAYF